MKKNIYYLVLFFILVPTNVSANTSVMYQPQNTIITTIFFIIIFIVIYFLLIRPQLQKEKKHKNLLENLKKEDEIITINGIVGIIKKIRNNYILLKLNDNNSIWISKQSVIKILPDGTIKNLNYDN